MRKTKKWAMILALVLAAMMVFSVVFSIIYTARAATTLSSLKDRQKELAADKKRIAEKLTSAKSDKQSLINRKIALDEQIDITEKDIENTTLLIQEYQVQIAETQQRYMDALDAEKEKKDKYRLRIRAMEEAGDVSYISIIMQSSSFSDLLGRISIMSEIADGDQKTIDELKAACDEIADAKQQLDVEKLEQLESRRLLSDAQEELAKQYDELDTMISDIEADISEFETLYNEAAKEEKAVQDEYFKLLEESKKKNAVYVGGDFIWPLPSSYNITSPFGTRKHPILGVNKYHSGVDIGAAKGSAILAANSGTVILAKYNGGYGNCVVIDHGGGVATLYGHASKLLVTNGQKVSQGDKIALVGSTGLSTGPHLHFEVIKDGKQIDPMGYFNKA